MPGQIRLSKEQLNDLCLIRDVPEAVLSSMIGGLRALGALPVKPVVLHRAMVDSVAGDPTAAEALFRQVISLRGLIRQTNLTSDEVFEALRETLSSGISQWTAEEVERWEQIEPMLLALFELDVVVLTSKALDLSYEYSHLLQRARILTDLRPVFDQDGTALKGAVIAHTLLLRYDDIEGEHTLSVAVDEQDILSIQRQCERALKKAVTIQAHLEQTSGMKAIVPGSDNDE